MTKMKYNKKKFEVDFEKYADGLCPTIIQDAKTLRVLMLGFMNEESLQKTIDDGLVTFYSRSKKRLWTKGESSGNHMKVKDILVDCDQDALLIKVNPHGPVCHTGSDTCFSEENTINALFLNELQKVIRKRKEKPKKGSYTSKLINRGTNKIAQKVGEEAVELVIEAMDDNNEDLFVAEAADLMYHYLVLLTARGHSLEDVLEELNKRKR